MLGIFFAKCPGMTHNAAVFAVDIQMSDIPIVAPRGCCILVLSFFFFSLSLSLFVSLCLFVRVWESPHGPSEQKMWFWGKVCPYISGGSVQDYF